MASFQEVTERLKKEYQRKTLTPEQTKAQETLVARAKTIKRRSSSGGISRSIETERELERQATIKVQQQKAEQEILKNLELEKQRKEEQRKKVLNVIYDKKASEKAKEEELRKLGLVQQTTKDGVKFIPAPSRDSAKTTFGISNYKVSREKSLKPELDKERFRLDAGVQSGQLTLQEAQKLYDVFKASKIAKYDNQFLGRKPSGIVSVGKKETRFETLLKDAQAKYTEVKVNISKIIRDIDKDLDLLFKNTDVNRDELRIELTDLKQSRSKEINLNDALLKQDLKKANTLTGKEKEKMKEKAFLDARNRLIIIRKKYDERGAKLQNKLLVATTKSFATETIKSAKDISKFAVNYVKDDELRKTVNSTVKELFENKEARENVKAIIKEEIKGFGVLLKTSPTEALMLIGLNVFSGVMVGKAFKPVAKISGKAIKGVVNVSGKTMQKSVFITRTIKALGTPISIVKGRGQKVFRVIQAKSQSKFNIFKGNIKRNVPAKFKDALLKKNKVLAKRERLLKKGALPTREKRAIGGVKVTKKEFKSFKEGIKKYKEDKKYLDFIDDLESKGSIGEMERIGGKRLTQSELKLLSGIKNVDSKMLKDVVKIDVTTLVNKWQSNIPILKRYAGGIWNYYKEPKNFYQNIVSYGLINKQGKFLGSVSFSTISKKPIDKFRNTLNAIKYGTNKNVIYSKSHGNKYVQSLVKSLDKRTKQTVKQYITKFKDKISKGIFLGEKDVVQIKVPITKIKFETRAVTKGFKVKKAFSEGRIVLKGQVGTRKLRGKEIIVSKDKISKVKEKVGFRKKPINEIKFIKRKQKKRIGKFKEKSKNKFDKKGYVSNKGRITIKKTDSKRISIKSSLASKSLTKPKVSRRLKIVGEKDIKKEIALAKKLRNKFIKTKSNKALNRSVQISLTSSINVLSNAIKALQKSKSKQALDDLRLLENKTLSKVKSDLSKPSKSISVNLLTIKPRIIPIIPIKKITLIKEKKKQLFIRKKETDELVQTKTLSKPAMVFNIVIKKRGKNVILNKRLIERDAKDFMAYELDNTLIRTARIVPAGISKIVTKLSKKYEGEFARKKSKLRPFKIKSKKKVPIRGFIEKKKFAVDTKREKSQLSRLIKSKRKTNKRKTTKTTRVKKKK